MKVRITKLVPEAHIPQYLKEGDAAMAIVATSKIFDEHGNAIYGTGLSIEIPSGYVGLIFPMDISHKKDLTLAHSVAIIDPNDREEIVLKFKPAGFFADVPTDLRDGVKSESFDFICFGKEYADDTDITALYEIGDRVGQLIILPRPIVEWVEVLNFTATAVKFDRKNANSTGGEFQGSHLL